jgi:Na+/citrate or Na+/malate symporter
MINQVDLKCDVKQPEIVIVTLPVNMIVIVTVAIAKMINQLNLQMLRRPFRTQKIMN